ncbi:MAG: MerR family transcriptional regulator [Ilumatobacteraceae bacterium]|jgi:DNA-binding transcriptional MerR regulator|nr:MerR family transcriptional regulator [Ilumatobacteraceae bacterium]
MTQQSFSGAHAAQIAGITYRQLDYWARTNLIRPSLVDAKGSGSRRSYVYRDLLELKVIKNLLDAGIKLESVREVFNYLRSHVDTDIAAAHIVISGKAVVLCQGDQLVDVLRNGQGVLNVLPLAAVKSDVDAMIVNIATQKVAIRSTIESNINIVATESVAQAIAR